MLSVCVSAVTILNSTALGFNELVECVSARGRGLGVVRGAQDVARDIASSMKRCAAAGSTLLSTVKASQSAADRDTPCCLLSTSYVMGTRGTYMKGRDGSMVFGTKSGAGGGI